MAEALKAKAKKPLKQARVKMIYVYRIDGIDSIIEQSELEAMPEAQKRHVLAVSREMTWQCYWEALDALETPFSEAI